MSEPQNNPIRDLNNARNLPRETVKVSKEIGRLGASLRFKHINLFQFAVKAQAELNKLADVEEERYRYRKALERLRDCDWTITLPDRMDAVRAIAREALGE